jgi:hypothetical protein
MQAAHVVWWTTTLHTRGLYSSTIAITCMQKHNIRAQPLSRGGAPL